MILFLVCRRTIRNITLMYRIPRLILGISDWSTLWDTCEHFSHNTHIFPITPTYEELYKIFNSSDFPAEDENIEIYHNVQRSRIHLVVAWPNIFPYNEAMQLCFKQFYVNTTTIVRKQGNCVASLGPEDISVRYHLPTPTCYLNEPFLIGFSKGNKGTMNLMNHWWADEEKTLKQGELCGIPKAQIY